jgi:hypothetical protein
VTSYDEVYERILRRESGESAPDWALSVLNDIGEGYLTVTAVRHPLGFTCLPVVRDGPDGVCIHVWDGPPVAQPTTSAVHAHSWDLVSYVLYGRVRNETVTITDEPVAPTHRLFEVTSQGDLDEIRATRRLVRSTIRSAQTNDRAETYTVPAGQFHATVVPGNQAATVALGRTSPGTVDLSLGGLDMPTHRVRRRPCDRTATMRLARSVARRIASDYAGRSGEGWRSS